MKIPLISILLVLCLALGTVGCTISANSPAAEPVNGVTTIRFAGDQVAITGLGASLDGGDVVIVEPGIYEISGFCDRSRVIVKAADTADVTIVLAGLELTNPEDEAVYFKTCGSASVVLKKGTENTLVSGKEPLPPETQSLTITDEGEEPTGAALRARCAMTISGEGSLTVRGWINNGIAADGGLTIESGNFNVAAVNDALKSDASISITGGTFTVDADHDGITAGLALDIAGGTFDITTGASSGGAEMKISDSSMMGGGGMGGGPGGGRGNRRASNEASTEAENTTVTEAVISDTNSKPAAESASEPNNSEASDDTESSNEAGANREMMQPGGMPGFDDMMDAYDADNLGSDSYKGLKAGASITISGGTFLLDCEDDAIHSDGIVAITGGSLLLLSGDDGIRGETELVISGGDIDVSYCYEGLEATSILITGGSTNIVATDDGMNAGGGMMGMMGGGPSREASTEAETEDTSSESAETETEITNPIVRITGGTVIVDSGGDGLDSNGSMYIEGGTIFVSGPSTNWDSPIDCGEGSNEFVVTGGHFMAAGYSAMVETPEATENSQASIFYSQSEYTSDNALVTLTDTSGRILAEYSFAHSFNCVMISTPEMAQSETYTLTIDGTDTTIEMTSAVYSNRGGSGEMGRGGRP